MEILINKKRAKHALVLCFLLLLITFIAISPLNDRGTVARADNSDIIGSGGGYVEIADVTEGLVNATYSSRATGRKLKITMPKSTVSVYFAYELDSSEQIYAIKGDADIDKDIPFKLHEGKVEKHSVLTSTLGVIESSWTDITLVNDKQVFYVEVHFNGTLYVECALNGETDRLKADTLVKDIDCLGPRLSAFGLKEGLRDASDERILPVQIAFDDKEVTNLISSAQSGLAEILIVRTNVALDEETEENLENLAVDNVASWEPLSPNQTILNQKLEFDINQNGYYYYFVVDRVGNLLIKQLIHIDYDNRFDVTDTSAGSSGATYSVKDYMILIGDELSEYKDAVSSVVYENAVNAYSELLLRFYAGESQTDREGISNAYFSFFRNEYTIFKNAYSQGANYSTTTVNGDLLLPATIKCYNLNKETITSLGGQVVVANFIVANYEGDKLDKALLDVANLEGDVKAYKLTYTLTVNGLQSTLPKAPLVFEIFGLPQTVADFKVYLKTADGYVECEQLGGENWLRFSSTLNGGEYYLVYRDASRATNLLPLWITLGVVGGAGVIAGIVVIILWKKGVIKRGKPKKEGENPTTNNNP